MTSAQVRRILREVSEEPHDDTTPSISDWPARLTEMCARELPISGVGLALMTEAGHAGTVATSDDRAAFLEDLQFTMGEGPCLESSRSGRPALHADLARSGAERWPAFTIAAIDAGIAAVFALPMQVGAIRVGVLDLYRDRAGPLHPTHLGDALSFADAATALVLHLHTREGESASVDESGVDALWRADHSEVHQATGMVSVQADVTLAQALSLLRARAFADGVSLPNLSRAVLAGELRLSDDRDGQA